MIEYNVYVDWDYADLADAFDFSQDIDDISSDVKNRVNIGRKEGDVGQMYPAGVAEFMVTNHLNKYFPYNAESELFGKIRLYLPVKIVMVYDAVEYIRYVGFISKIIWHPIPSEQDVFIYCVDGSEALSKAMVIQDMDDKDTITTGDGIDEILDAAGWNAARRIIDYGSGDIIKHPDTFAFEKP